MASHRSFRGLARALSAEVLEHRRLTRCRLAQVKSGLREVEVPEVDPLTTLRTAVAKRATVAPWESAKHALDFLGKVPQLQRQPSVEP